MAERRMFAKTIIDSDAFLDMPISSQNLYFHLGMRADDDGVINNPKSIMRLCGAKDVDMNLLINKKFVLLLDEAIIVIKHWKINNYIQKDRYKPSKYLDLINSLSLDENGAYTDKNQQCIHNGYIVDTQVSIGKDSIDKDNNKKEIIKEKYGEFNNVTLSNEELEKLKEKFPKDYQNRIEKLSAYIASTGKKYKSHYATILNWSRKEEQNKPQSTFNKTYTTADYEECDF